MAAKRRKKASPKRRTKRSTKRKTSKGKVPIKLLNTRLRKLNNVVKKRPGGRPLKEI